MPRKPKKIPQIVSDEQFQKILRAIIKEKQALNGGSEMYYFRKVRNCMIFFLMFYLGLRPKEAYGSKVEHISIENGTIFIPGENNKQRNSDTIPLPDFVRVGLLKYMKIRERYFKDSPWLFPSNHWRSKGRLAHNVLAGVFKDAVRRAGILHTCYVDSLGRKISNLNPYSLRHSFGSRAYEKTHDIKKTAYLLRQYDWQCRNALVYIHTLQNKNRSDLYDEMYSDFVGTKQKEV